MKRTKTANPGIYRQSNGKYLASVRVGGGERYWETFPTIKEAREWQASVKTDHRRDSFVHPDAGKIPFGRFARSVVDSWSHLRPTTAANVESRLNKHLLPHFGRKPLDSIRPVDVRDWITSLNRAGLAPSTIKATYRNFAKIMRTAELDRLITRSPCIGIDLPREGPREEMLFLTAQEVRKLADAIHPRFSAVIYTAAYAGPRFGELAALKVGRANLDAGTLDVVESLSDVNGHLHLGPTKTGKRRTLLLPAFLAEMLREQMGLFPSTEGYLFSAPKGGPLRHHNFYRRYYKPAVVAAGLNPALRFHDLRHTCAALFIAEGAHPKEIQEQLGHSSIKVTLDRYGHLLPHLTQRLRDGLETAFQVSSGSAQKEEKFLQSGENRGRSLNTHEQR